MLKRILSHIAPKPKPVPTEPLARFHYRRREAFRFRLCAGCLAPLALMLAIWLLALIFNP